MKKFFFCALVFLSAISCNKNKANIQGIIEGVSDGNLVLKVLELNTQKVVDTLLIEDGKINYSLNTKDKSPNFYYLYYKENKIASMVILPGDRIKLMADTLGQKIVVEGSEESSLLVDLEKGFGKVQSQYDSLTLVLNEAIKNNDISKQTSLNYEFGALYVKQKQNAIKRLYSHPYSITNITLLYHRFPNNLPLFADVRDVLLFKRVCDSLKVPYPESIYVSTLFEEISKREKSDLFNEKIMDASETGFPDISLPDVNSKVRSLSDFSGKIIILSFWSVRDVNQKMLNHDFLYLYDKYRSKGLEIFQVSVDIDKTEWSRAVADQMLPWISVCDGLGSNSAAVKTYNIQKLPSLFVIDKSGTIVAKDVYNDKLEKVILNLTK